MAESWPGARKLCFFFYRPWQLTGYWEQGPNDTATQQISTSSASCSFEQIRSLPPLGHNRAATAKQPPANRAPTLLQPQNFLVWSFSGPQLHQGVLPQSPEPTPTPIGKMCVFQVSKYCHLPESSMASPFRGGCVLRLPALQQGYMWPHTATGPQDGSGEFSRHSWSQQIKHTYIAHLHFPRLGNHFQLSFPLSTDFTTKECLDVSTSHHTHSTDLFFPCNTQSKTRT